jgi:hypothetical protein
MSALDSDASTKSLLKEWTHSTLRPLLVIVRVTIIFIFALLADTLILAIISWTFGNTINQNPFGARLLEGIRLLSALGTAAAYIIYLLRSLFKDTKEALEEFRSGNKQEVPDK